jgi:hypothetical protein
VPRGAPALAALLEEHLLVHEPQLRVLPQFADQLADRALAQERLVVLVVRRARVAEVLVEGPVDAVERA